MTIKALRKTSIIFATSIMLTIPTVTASHAGGNSGGSEVTVDGGHMLSVCVLDGGTVTTAANGDNHCKNPKTGKTTDCSGPNGSPNACWTEGRPIHGKLIKPVLSGGTMIMLPDTNTTVGTGAKPLARKLIRRNVIRK